MAHADIIVLGAGIVGASVALHLAKRGVSVALIDRASPGEGTSYGNAGIIEGNTIFPAAFPSGWSMLARIALKRSAVANYHLGFLPTVAPWLMAFRAASEPQRLIETARLMRPLFARAVEEHSALSAEAGAERYFKRNGWLKLYRTDASFAGQARELALAREWGIANVPLDADAALALEPSLAPVFRRAVHWTGAVSVSNPLAVTRAYVARFTALGGLVLTGDARSLHRSGSNWRVDTAEGPLDAGHVVVALGPWTPDVLGPLGIKLPLAVKRGYHRHFRPARKCQPEVVRCSMPTTVIASRRWSRAFASPRASSSLHAMRRRRPFSSIACCPRRANYSRSASRSNRSRGWDHVRVSQIPGQ